MRETRGGVARELTTERDSSCLSHPLLNAALRRRPRTLWFDAGQRGESRDKQCDDQPREPTHAAVTDLPV